MPFFCGRGGLGSALVFWDLSGVRGHFPSLLLTLESLLDDPAAWPPQKHKEQKWLSSQRLKTGWLNIKSLDFLKTPQATKRYNLLSFATFGLKKAQKPPPASSTVFIAPPKPKLLPQTKEFSAFAAARRGMMTSPEAWLWRTSRGWVSPVKQMHKHMGAH